MPGLALTGTGLYTPQQSISNDELVASFNAYVRRHNEANAAAIAAGNGRGARALLDRVHRQGVGHQEPLRDRQGGRARSRDHVPAHSRALQRPDLGPGRDGGRRRARGDEALPAAAPSDIDGVLVGASNMQRAYPAMAVEVQDALGIDGFGFDMNVACSSATFALQAAADMVAAGTRARSWCAIRRSARAI